MATIKPVSDIRVVATLALLYVFRMLGLFMVFPVMMLFGVDYEGATPFLLGLALGGYGLTQALFQIPFGLLSDIWGRKPVILIGFLIFLLGSIVAAMSDSVWGLVIGRVLQGSGAIASAVMALVGDLTSEQNRTRSMAIIGISIGLSFSVAMVVGPALAASGGLAAIFWFTAVLAGLGIAVLVFLVPDPPIGQTSGSDGVAVPALLKKSVSNPDLLRLNWGIFCLHFVLTGTFVVVPIALKGSGVGAEQHWQYYLPVILVAFLAMLPFVYVAERKRKVKNVFVGAVALLMIAELGLGWAVGLWHWVLGLFLFFTAFNLLEAMLPSLISKQAPAGSKGTAMGVYSTCQFLGAAAGGMSGGICYQYWGVSGVLFLCAAVSAAWLAVSLGMRHPRYLTSVCVPHQTALEEDELIDMVPGVVEVSWVKEQALLYLKVDDRTFKRNALTAFLRRTDPA